MAEIGELSVRQDKPDYGKVAGHVLVLGNVRPEGRRILVLLIHGYANSQSAASSSYNTCVGHLQDAAAQANSGLISPIFKVYWPGDVSIPVISQLSYPWQIPHAIDSGARLAEFLTGLAGPDGTPIEIHLVSHSLGGRVVLEMIKRAMASRSILFRSMSMMACAVPVHMVENTRQLLFPALEPQQRQVLFSAFDIVLTAAFRLGEMAADEGFLPQAVGSFGHPDGIWQQEKMKGWFQHWDYWPSELAANTLASFLKIPVSVPTPANGIPSRPALEERAAPQARDLSVRPQPGQG